jgi:hypothetical protein
MGMVYAHVFERGRRVGRAVWMNPKKKMRKQNA